MTEKIKLKLQVVIPGRENELRHDIDVELDYDDFRTVRGALPSINGSHQTFFEGRGESTLGAVLDWLRKVDRSLAYTPAYRRAEAENASLRK